MRPKQRKIDQAMHQERAEKITMREIWCDIVSRESANYSNSSEPLYLTLSGAEGKDIDLLIKKGLISLTETNAIDEKDQNKIVAVESNNEAISQLQKKFVGLKIKEVDFRSLIRGDEVFTWPQGVDEIHCRAKVVNLDLNGALVAELNEDSIEFPVINWIKKLCHIHKKSNPINWVLCLTLHGEIPWPNEISSWAKQFIIDNFHTEADFKHNCLSFFKKELLDILNSPSDTNFNTLSRQTQQELIMIIVPKLIASNVIVEGWKTTVEKNIRYGGSKEHAPMVSWVISFTYSSKSIKPKKDYSSALATIFNEIRIIDSTGKLIS